MPTILADLELDDAELLSVVDRGASGNAISAPRIVLIKRAERVRKQGEPMSPEEVNAALEALRSALSEEQMAMVMRLVEAAAMTPEPEAPAEETAEPEQMEMQMDGEEEKAEGADEEKAAEGEEEKAAELDEETKADDEEVAKRHAEELSKGAQELAKAQAEVVKLRDEMRMARLMKRATDDYAGLPGMDAAQVAGVLKAVEDGMPAKQASAVLEALKAASASVTAGDMLKSAGRAGERAKGGAMAEIEILARKRMESRPGMALAVAKSHIMDEQPELFRAARSEAKGA